MEIQKKVWLKVAESKYLVDKDKISKIRYFMLAMDEKYQKKRYYQDRLILTLADHFEPILKHILEYIEENNINLNKLYQDTEYVDTGTYNNYLLMLEFSDYIQEDSIIIALIKDMTKLDISNYINVLDLILDQLEVFPWLDLIESLEDQYIKLKHTLEQYYTRVKNFKAIRKCSIFWQNDFYQIVYQIIIDIDKSYQDDLIESKILNNQKLHRNKSAIGFVRNKHINELYSLDISNFDYNKYDGQDGGYFYIDLTNNMNFKLAGVGDCCNEVYITLHPDYQELSEYIGKKIINIRCIKTKNIKNFRASCNNEYMDRKTYEILFDDGSIFLFYSFNKHNGYYDGYIEITKK